MELLFARLRSHDQWETAAARPARRCRWHRGRSGLGSGALLARRRSGVWETSADPALHGGAKQLSCMVGQNSSVLVW